MTSAKQADMIQGSAKGDGKEDREHILEPSAYASDSARKLWKLWQTLR